MWQQWWRGRRCFFKSKVAVHDRGQTTTPLVVTLRCGQKKGRNSIDWWIPANQTSLSLSPQLSGCSRLHLHRLTRIVDHHSSSFGSHHVQLLTTRAYYLGRAVGNMSQRDLWTLVLPDVAGWCHALPAICVWEAYGSHRCRDQRSHREPWWRTAAHPLQYELRHVCNIVDVLSCASNILGKKA